MVNRKVLSSRALRRIARRQFIIILGPLAATWDGGKDPRVLDAGLRGEISAGLNGLDLTDAYTALHGRDALCHQMKALIAGRAGRLHERLAALRPPYVFSYDVSGMICIAGKNAGLDVNVLYLDQDNIRRESADRLIVLPIMGHAEDPKTLVLSDANRNMLRTREVKSIRFLRDKIASHEVLLIGFQPMDDRLHGLLRMVGAELKKHDNRALLFVESSSDPERALLERRGGETIRDSAKQTLIFFEQLPEMIKNNLAAGPSEEEIKIQDLAERLRRKIHDDTRFITTIGISQPEHLEIGDPPTLDEIYVAPTLSSWAPALEEIDRSLVERLARECEVRGTGIPVEVRHFIEGKKSDRPRRGAQLYMTDPEEGRGDFFEALQQMGYPVRGRFERISNADPMDTLKRFARVVIIGEPASGKTLLLREIAHTLTKPSARGDDALARTIPLIVPMREYHAQKEHGLRLPDYLAKRLTDLIGEEAGTAGRLFEENRVLLLLDGLDEVPTDEKRRSAASEIDRLLGERPAMRCVVTSRPAGYRAAGLATDLPHFRLDLFDDGRIRKLLHFWFLRIQNKDPSAQKDAEAQAEERERELFDRLRAIEGLLDLCRNPLMLTLAIFIHHVGLRLPERRADFYQRAAHHLSMTWLGAKSGLRIELPKSETMIAALGNLGFLLHRDYPENVLSGEDFLGLLSQVFREHEGYGEERTVREAKNLLELARNLLGIVVERGTDLFGFSHLSFQEYFAAHHLALGDGRHLAIETLVRNLYESRWDQVIRLYLQVAPPDDARTLFHRLREARHPFDDLFHPNSRRLAELLVEPNAIIGEQVSEIVRSLAELARSSPYSELRIDALIKLGAMRREREMPAVKSVLLTAMKDMDSDMRQTAARGLSEMAVTDPEARAALLAAMADENWQVRQTAVRGLAGLAGTDAGARAALQAAMADENWRVRRAAAEGQAGLAGIDPDARAAFLAAMKDENSDVRQAVAGWLAGLAGTDAEARAVFLAALKDENSDVRHAVVGWLAGLAGTHPEARTALLSVMKDKDFEVRQAAAKGLAGLAVSNEEARTAFFATMKDKDSRVRQAAAKGLAGLAGTDEGARAALLSAIKDENWRVRRAAAEGLAGLAETDAVARTALVTVMRDKDFEVRQAAAKGLSGLAGTNAEARAAFLTAMRDKDFEVRQAAAKGLAGLVGTDAEARAAMMAAMKDENRIVRQAAARGLAGLAGSDKEARAVLLAAMKNENWMVQRAAARGLAGRIGTDAEARAASLAAMKGVNWQVRQAAAEGLAGLARTDAEARAACLAAFKDENWQVRQSAAEGLAGSIGADAEVRAEFLRAMKDANWQVRQAAAEGLAALAGDEEARAVLLAAMKDENWQVRQAAVQGLVGALDGKNWREIKKNLTRVSPLTMGPAFYSFDPLLLGWDYVSDGLVYESGRWLVRKTGGSGAGARVKASGSISQEARRTAKIIASSPSPSGLKGLRPDVNLLVAQYTHILTSKTRKRKIRETAARWFGAFAEDIIASSGDHRIAKASYLAELASFIERLAIAVRDEDDAYKSELFEGIWPSVRSLHENGLLGVGRAARHLFEALNRLYLYLPERQKSELETTLTRWREKLDPEKDREHPLRDDPSVKRILRTAKTRKRR